MSVVAEIAKSLDSLSTGFSNQLTDISRRIDADRSVANSINNLTEVDQEIAKIDINAVSQESIKSLSKSDAKLTQKIEKQIQDALTKTGIEFREAKEQKSPPTEGLKAKFDKWLKRVFDLAKQGKQEQASTALATFLHGKDQLNSSGALERTTNDEYSQLAQVIVGNLDTKSTEYQEFMAFVYQLTNNDQFLTVKNLLASKEREVLALSHDAGENETTTKLQLYGNNVSIKSNNNGVASLQIEHQGKTQEITDDNIINEFQNNLFDNLVKQLVDKNIKTISYLAIQTLNLLKVKEPEVKDGAFSATLTTNDGSREAKIIINTKNENNKLELENIGSITTDQKYLPTRILKLKIKFKPPKILQEINFPELIKIADLSPENFKPPTETGERIPGGISAETRRGDRHNRHRHHTHLGIELSQVGLTYNESTTKKRINTRKKNYKHLFNQRIVSKVSHKNLNSSNALKVLSMLNIQALIKYQLQTFTMYPPKFSLLQREDGQRLIRFNSFSPYRKNETLPLYIDENNRAFIPPKVQTVYGDIGIRAGNSIKPYQDKFDKKLSDLDTLSSTNLFTSLTPVIKKLNNFINSPSTLQLAKQNPSQFYKALQKNLTTILQNDKDRLNSVLNDLYKITTDPIFIGPDKALANSEINLHDVKQSNNETKVKIKVKGCFPEELKATFTSFLNSKGSDLSLELSNKNIEISAYQIADLQNKLFEQVFKYNTNPIEILKVINTLKFTGKASSNNKYTGTLASNDGNNKVVYQLDPKENKLTFRTSNLQFEYPIDTSNKWQRAIIRRISPRISTKLEISDSLNYILENKKTTSITIKKERSNSDFTKNVYQNPTQNIRIAIPNDPKDKALQSICYRSETKDITYRGNGVYRLRIKGKNTRGLVVQQQIKQSHFKGTAHKKQDIFIQNDSDETIFTVKNNLSNAQISKIDVDEIKYPVKLYGDGNGNISITQLPVDDEDLKIKHHVRDPIKNQNFETGADEDFIELRSGDELTFVSDRAGQNEVFKVVLP